MCLRDRGKSRVAGIGKREVGLEDKKGFGGLVRRAFSDTVKNLAFLLEGTENK